MHKHVASLFVVVLCLSLLHMSCSVPRRIWRQDDIEPYESGGGSADRSVLIASSTSDFKEALVARIRASLEDDRTYLKVIGLGELEDVDADQYDALVIINRCVAWGLDTNADSFLDRHEDYDNIVVLTTSGDGGWLPAKKGRAFDAVSAASDRAMLDETAGEVVERVQGLLDG
jgi:hypothetical protein